MLVSCRDINCVTKEDHQEDHISRCYKMPYMPTISAEANIPFHLAESLLSITTTIGPSRQCRGQYFISFGRIITINHHHHWAQPSALATAVQPAHPSEIPTISNGPIIGWPVSHGTLSTSAVRYRRTNTLKGLDWQSAERFASVGAT